MTDTSIAVDNNFDVATALMEEEGLICKLVRDWTTANPTLLRSEVRRRLLSRIPNSNQKYLSFFEEHWSDILNWLVSMYPSKGDLKRQMTCAVVIWACVSDFDHFVTWAVSKFGFADCHEILLALEEMSRLSHLTAGQRSQAVRVISKVYGVEWVSCT
jgi:hypothetical protein